LLHAEKDVKLHRIKNNKLQKHPSSIYDREKEHFAGFNFTSASGSNLIFIDGGMSEPIIGTCWRRASTQVRAFVDFPPEN
jgi:hypothetical protein